MAMMKYILISNQVHIITRYSTFVTYINISRKIMEHSTSKTQQV